MERLWVLVLGKDPNYEADINDTGRVIICAEVYMACGGYWSRVAGVVMNSAKYNPYSP